MMALSPANKRMHALCALQQCSELGLTSKNTVLGSVRTVECLDDGSWEVLRARCPILLLTGVRASMLGLGEAPIALITKDLSLAQLMACATAPKDAMPNHNKAGIMPPKTEALLQLCKQAQILPALLWFEENTQLLPDSFSLDIDTLDTPVPLYLSKGNPVSLPLEGATNSLLTGFRSRHDVTEHLALALGNPHSNAPPLVRVHSSCVTGDLLGSLRCDCGDQLHGSIAQMKADPAGGVLLYLHQEGRGIGISNKLRAYALQEQGIDTYSANRLLGFEEDERDFTIAIAMLQSLGLSSIRLLTNNPDKMQVFKDSGIEVVEYIPMNSASNEHNHDYLTAKRLKQS